MEAHQTSLEGTTVEGRFGIEYEFDRVNGSAVVWIHHNDGSRGSVWLDNDYEYEIIRCGRDDSVGIRRTYNDGSTRYFGIPTELFNQIRGVLLTLVN